MERETHWETQNRDTVRVIERKTHRDTHTERDTHTLRVSHAH